jgi:cytochrome c oxidase subunit 1/cytochrome c oxidase subunit I+III
MNGISSVSVIFMIMGTLVLAWNIVISLRHGRMAGNNPWGGFTLEWATTSPPPPENFATLPEIKSRRPVWDLEHPKLADWKVAATPRDSLWRPAKVKVLAWAFVASEAIFFVLLVASYIVFNTRVDHEGPVAATALNAIRTGAFTVFLIASSATFWLAEQGLRAGSRSRFLGWLSLTILLGAVFLAGQAAEYKGLLANNITIDRNLFASTFFTVTGFHGLHVFGGLVALSILLALGWKGILSSQWQASIGAIGIYWHFVDVVWIVVFSIIYLGVLQ